MTHDEFLELFPDDESCLAYLKERFYPDDTTCPGCGRGSRFHRLSGRSAYSCQFCGMHVYPTAGTIFYRSTTPLQLWFWAVFLISSTRGGISVSELQREVGVSHKTALRMADRIGGLLGLEVQDVVPVSEPGAGTDEPESARARSREPSRRSIWNARRRQA